MKTILIRFSVLACLLVIASTAKAQSIQVAGTPHGVEVIYTAASQGTDPNAIAGYFIFRCSGTATTCINTSPVGWVQENTSPDAALSYLDPATNGFTNGLSYTYAVQTVDVKGNVSVFSNTSTVQVPSSGFPSNPNAPAAPTVTVQ